MKKTKGILKNVGIFMCGPFGRIVKELITVNYGAVSKCDLHTFCNDIDISFAQSGGVTSYGEPDCVDVDYVTVDRAKPDYCNVDRR